MNMLFGFQCCLAIFDKNYSCAVLPELRLEEGILDNPNVKK